MMGGRTKIEWWGPETGGHLQGRVSNFGWCFHGQDEILVHKRAGKEIS